MITALTALLVLISLALVVTVPVALATPGEWESSKDQFNKAFQLWVLVLLLQLLLQMVFHHQFS
jgi:photosystem II core protein PsbZ